MVVFGVVLRRRPVLRNRRLGPVHVIGFLYLRGRVHMGIRDRACAEHVLYRQIFILKKNIAKPVSRLLLK